MPSKTSPKTDDLGIPPGAMFTAEEAAEILHVTQRQLRRWRSGKPPVLAAKHPKGERGPAFYTRAELIRFLTS